MSANEGLWAIDTSPLILLAKIGLLSLVPRMVSAVDIPEVVIAEVEAGPPNDAARGPVNAFQ